MSKISTFSAHSCAIAYFSEIITDIEKNAEIKLLADLLYIKESIIKADILSATPDKKIYYHH
ncbi:MAG: hypothetical protein KZQ70_13755 [gamma proteobacterium symbiont of Lucinoma myriamae]|nr:hypothetical protein [gamma proteobacterium symbiont of Lucinoma myriamae]MCU7819625.1 hypothetical protein [gamma proteobacterium symbiont of Lucinoma myriamae]